MDKIKLEKINDIKVENSIKKLSVFPCGKFIGVSSDCAIRIWEKDYSLFQYIPNAHSFSINYVEIKDNNEFSTCSADKSIKIFKLNDIFVEDEKISEAHDKNITKIIYDKENRIISCSMDKTIKIWEKKASNHQNVITVKQKDSVYSIFLIEDKQILLSSGKDGTYLWNSVHFNLISYIKDAMCLYCNSLDQFDEKNMILGYHKVIKIINLENQKIIQPIFNDKEITCLFTLKKEELFFTAGGKDIKVYKNNNYECILKIYDAHCDDILGFTLLKKNVIASYSKSGGINIWKIS